MTVSWEKESFLFGSAVAADDAQNEPETGLRVQRFRELWREVHRTSPAAPIATAQT